MVESKKKNFNTLENQVILTLIYGCHGSQSQQTLLRSAVWTNMVSATRKTLK